MGGAVTSGEYHKWVVATAEATPQASSNVAVNAN